MDVRVFSQVYASRKKKAEYPLFYFNLLWLACKFDLDQTERKSSQVIASQHKCTQALAKLSRK